MNEIECLLCDSSESRVVIEENGFQGRKCAGCGLIYVSPRPDKDEIHDLYGHDQARVTAESHISSAFPKRLYARHHLGLIQRHQSRGRLLEVGAGAGYFLDEARKRGFSCHAIEFNPIQAGYIAEHLRIDCEQTSLGESSYMEETFDLIYHCDVISHFYNPIEELTLMNRVLKMGGYMVFETGNIGDMDDEHLRYIPRFQYPDHLFFFGEDNLERLLQKSGFETVAIHRFSLMPQLRVSRLVALIKDRVIDGHSQSTAGGRRVNQNITMQTEQRPLSRLWSSLRTLKTNTMEYLYFHLRYSVGKLWVKPGQAQTLIVVARKTVDMAA